MNDAVGTRLQFVADSITALVDEIGSRPTVSGLVMRVELEKIMRNVPEIHNDVMRLHEAFRSTLKQKQKLEGEVLDLMRNYEEIQRLQREIKV